MGHTDRYGDGHSRIRVEKGVRKGERLIRVVEKTTSSWHGWIDCFIAEDRAFVRDRPDTCGTCIGQLERLKRLMNNHSKSQRKQKRSLWPIYHQRNWTPLTVNRMTGYPFNIWPLALTIHCVTERGPSRKTSVRVYPAENMTYLEPLLR